MEPSASEAPSTGLSTGQIVGITVGVTAGTLLITVSITIIVILRYVCITVSGLSNFSFIDSIFQRGVMIADR